MGSGGRDLPYRRGPGLDGRLWSEGGRGLFLGRGIGGTDLVGGALLEQALRIGQTVPGGGGETHLVGGACRWDWVTWWAEPVLG